jgi:iron complex outermembrane receptor protein
MHCKKAILFFLFFLFGGTAFLFAQTHQLEGTVVDETSAQPIAYVAVFLPDLNRATTADENGHFILNDLPGNAQKFTFVRLGYHPLSKTISFSDSLTKITIALSSGGREMEEILIVGTQTHTENESATTIVSLSQRSLRSRGALSISDGVAKLPGVNQLSTGAGISKPVIRGMYGNRIQTVVMGMRFDNQQWQDEHGLGLQDIGVDRIEVIKGPAALMYGSEAMGGVINVLEEKPADVDSLRGDVGLRLFSNTYGAGLDAGVRSTKNNYSWRIRLGAESQADYSDGNNKRIQNSRFDGYVGKASFGYNRKKWVCMNNYLFSKSDFGFIMDTANALIPDSRISRGFANPHHTVFINLFTSQNTFFGDKGNIFRIIFGTHINRRMENEGGGGISLDMQLITVALHLQDELPLNEKLTWINGIQSQYQDNKNLGFRVIVPDATLAEASGYSYLKRLGKIVVFEAGLRYDLRYISTDTISHFLAYTEVPIVNKAYNTVNGSFGTSIALTDDLHFKANITSGYRTPNLAELQSNGLHEGTLRYEVGDADMTIEQNLCAEAGFSYERKRFEFTVAAFNNRFLNYIYLQPTNIDFFGATIYKYLQTNATLQGGEASIDWTPEKVEWLDISAAYSTVRGKTDEGNYLPFIPADRIDGALKFEFGDKGKFRDIYFRTGTQYFFPQNHPAQFETPTIDYMLLDIGTGSILKCKNGNTMNIDICCNNLLNKVYYDHLSRFKDFGIYNMGRMVCLNMKYEW